MWCMVCLSTIMLGTSLGGRISLVEICYIQYVLPSSVYKYRKGMWVSLILNDTFKYFMTMH